MNHIFRRLGYVISFVIVAGVAAVVSYTHLREVAVLGHQPVLVTYLLPLSVDGLMLIATVAMAEDKAAGRYPRGWARFGFWFGAAASVTANITATWVYYRDPVSIGVAAAAPVIFLFAVEIVSRPGKPKPQVTASPVTEMAEIEQLDPSTAPVSPAVVPAPVAPVRGTRKPQGPRNGVDYSQRHKNRLANGK